MRLHPRPLSMAVVVALALAVVAAWAAAVPAAAHADSSTIKTEPQRAFTIPASSTAILRWTFETAPAKAVTASFQISKDRYHWLALRKITVKAGQKVVRTSWRAPDRAETRFFRLKTSTEMSDVVTIRVQ